MFDVFDLLVCIGIGVGISWAEQDAFAEVQVIFDDAQNAFDDMQLPETAAEEPEE